MNHLGGHRVSASSVNCGTTPTPRTATRLTRLEWELLHCRGRDMDSHPAVIDCML